MYNNEEVSTNREYYLSLRNTIQMVCAKRKDSNSIDYVRLYELKPDNNITEDILYNGSDRHEMLIEIFKQNPNYIPAWEWARTKDGKQCYRYFVNSPMYVPVNIIFNRLKKLVDRTNIDIDEFKSARGIRLSLSWVSYSHLFDPALQPIPPGELEQIEEKNSYGHLVTKYYDSILTRQRRKEFIELIKAETVEFMEKFIRLTCFDEEGWPYFKNDNPITPEKRFDKGELYQLPSAKQLEEFPNWYQAYKNLLPGMCERISIVKDQNLCGDIWAKKLKDTQKN